MFERKIANTLGVYPSLREKLDQYKIKQNDRYKMRILIFKTSI